MIGFQLIKNDKPVSLNKVDEEIAINLYHTEVSKDHWAESPEGFDWYNSIGYDIAAKLNGVSTWRVLYKVLMSKSEQEFYTNWKRRKAYLKKYYVPVVRYLAANGYVPKGCGYVHN